MAIVLPKFSRRRPTSGLAVEAQPSVRLWLCNDEAIYRAGTVLTARWRFTKVPPQDLQSLEVSVLWHTEGKGDEDLYVHHFHRVSENQLRRSLNLGGGTLQEQSLECVLPVTPLSYHGRLIRLCWCVRLRLYLAGGRELVAEQPFYLVSGSSHTPCAASIASTSTSSDDESSHEFKDQPTRSAPQLIGNSARL